MIRRPPIVSMPRIWIKILLFLGSCAVALAAGGASAGWMRGVDGRPAGLFSACDRPLAAVIAVSAALIFSVLVGLLLARAVGRRAGLFIVGVALLGFAAHTGGAQSIVVSEVESWQMPVEAIAWSASLFLISLILLKGDRRSFRPDGKSPASFLHRHGWLPGCAAMLPIAWIMTRSELKGQTIAAACVASVAAGFLAQILMYKVRAVFFAGIPAMGAIGFIAAATVGGPLDLTQIPGGWSPLLLIMPQDFAAGALLGGVLGVVWADTILHERVERATPAGPVHAHPKSVGAGGSRT